MAPVSKREQGSLRMYMKADGLPEQLTDGSLRMSRRQQRKGGDIRHAQIRDAKDSSVRVGYGHGIVALAHFT